MNKDVNFIIALSTLLLITAIIYNNTIYSKKVFFGSYNNKIRKFVISGKANIIDGDSIKIKNYEIRLADIDAPEYQQICRTQQNTNYNCGIESYKYLKILSRNAKITCYIKGKDYYSRYLATCYNLDKNLNALMVKNGWAINYSDQNIYYKQEIFAKESKIGMWQGEFITPRQYRKLNPRS